MGNEVVVKKIDKRPDRISFTYGVTLNLGNFESLRVDAMMESDLAPGETYEQGIQRLKDHVIIDVTTTGHKMRHKLSSEQPANIIRKPWKKASNTP